MISLFSTKANGMVQIALQNLIELINEVPGRSRLEMQSMKSWIFRLRMADNW